MRGYYSFLAQKNFLFFSYFYFPTHLFKAQVHGKHCSSFVVYSPQTMAKSEVIVCCL